MSRKGHWQDVGTVKRWVPEPENNTWVWIVGIIVVLALLGNCAG